MHVPTRKPISRRTLLKGLGVSISLPLLQAMQPRNGWSAPSQFQPLAGSFVGPRPRMIFCYVPNGVNITQWVPGTTGSGYALSPTLEVLADHRADFTVLSGLGHHHSRGGHTGADTWLTGADLQRVPGRSYTNSMSADQLVAAAVGLETRVPSLELSEDGGTGSAGHSHTLAFDRNGTPLPAENSPRRLFERLFVSDSRASRAATLQRYAEKRSILDAVAAESQALEERLGQADRIRLQEYLNSVRETEQRVERLEAWVDVPKPDIDSQYLQLNSQPFDAHDRSMWIDVMHEISYLAFAADITRVITFEWSREAGGIGPSGENHHELSHHGGDGRMLDSLAVIDRFHLERLGRFLTLLKQTPEGDSNMLDHTMIMFGSGMNSGLRGDHSPDNLPLLVAGGKAWGLRHGQHIAHDPEAHPPLSNLLLTLIQGMGLEIDGFEDSAGTLDGLV